MGPDPTGRCLSCGGFSGSVGATPDRALLSLIVLWAFSSTVVGGAARDLSLAWGEYRRSSGDVQQWTSEDSRDVVLRCYGHFAARPAGWSWGPVRIAEVSWRRRTTVKGGSEQIVSFVFSGRSATQDAPRSANASGLCATLETQTFADGRSANLSLRGDRARVTGGVYECVFVLHADELPVESRLVRTFGRFEPRDAGYLGSAGQVFLTVGFIGFLLSVSFTVTVCVKIVRVRRRRVRDAPVRRPESWRPPGGFRASAGVVVAATVAAAAVCGPVAVHALSESAVGVRERSQWPSYGEDGCYTVRRCLSSAYCASVVSRRWPFGRFFQESIGSYRRCGARFREEIRFGGRVCRRGENETGSRDVSGGSMRESRVSRVARRTIRLAIVVASINVVSSIVVSIRSALRRVAVFGRP